MVLTAMLENYSVNFLMCFMFAGCSIELRKMLFFVLKQVAARMQGYVWGLTGPP